MSKSKSDGGQVKGGVVRSVIPGSIADDLGIRPGDVVVAVDGSPVRDELDFRFLTAAEELSLEVYRPDEGTTVFEIEKDYDEPIGIEFDDVVFDGIRRCTNRCIFCFVEQMPKGMRESLYIKDDDYRMSFLQGNFITMTNLREEDVQRIISQRLSPLYISVHTVDPDLRVTMMRNPRAAKVMEHLRRFRDAGIEMHGQIVMVPGYNDAERLVETVNALAELHPAMRSCAVVPVGLTKHREHLPKVSPVTQEIAERTLDDVAAMQARFLQTLGTRFIFASDEFYFKAKRPIPADEEYEDYPQTENGVGLVRIFWEEFREIALDPALRRAAKAPVGPRDAQEMILITGELGAKAITHPVEHLMSVTGRRARIVVVRNRFFGDTITVTGLLTGRDVAEAAKDAISSYGMPAKVVVPDIILRDAGDITLDDMTPEDIQREIDAPVEVVPATAEGLVRAFVGRRPRDGRTFRSGR